MLGLGPGPLLLVQLPPRTRVGNKGSLSFRNHGGGPYSGVLLVESGYCFTFKNLLRNTKAKIIRDRDG